MIGQLFQNWRRTDPASSQLSGEANTSSGRRVKQQIQAFALVNENPGMTSAELAEISDLDRYQLARRLPELVSVEKGDMRRCRVSGRMAVTWWPVEL